MANETAWEHFNEFLKLIKRVNNIWTEIEKCSDDFERLKKDVLEDTNGVAELQKIIDVHPSLTVPKLIKEYNRFKALIDYLKNNGYI